MSDALDGRWLATTDLLLAAHYRSPLASQTLSSPKIVPCLDDLIEVARKVNQLFHPGYFCPEPVSDLRDWTNRRLCEIHALLDAQITTACALEGVSPPRDGAQDWIRALPGIQARVLSDLSAAFDGDPAAKSYAEIILAYPGYEAVATYRLAHALFELGIPLLPRMLTEHAHRRTGIDIHPGATIQDRFFIDHGTGVVIGETARIGKNVKLYQGVTLGALSFPKDAAGNLIRNQKRHPTIEDDVVIYAGATILGGETVIGRGSVIGGNAWITSSVRPGSKIIQEKNA